MKDALRLTLARFLAVLLRVQSRPYPFPRGTALVVAPHADDETLGCGGLIAAKAQRGDRIEVVYLTDSAASDPGSRGVFPAVMARTRRAEALAALRILGVREDRVHFIDAPDGRLDRLGPEENARVRDRLATVLDSLQPAEVFLPYCGGGSTEHDAAFWLVHAVIAAAGRKPIVWEYPVWAWWNALRLRRQLAHAGENFHLELAAWTDVKRAALACHASQLQPATAPALPASLARACTGPVEFYFHRRA
jgi:LmbE family N-acetylglucosaminyl deacetylase